MAARRGHLVRRSRRETSWLDIEPVGVNFSAPGSVAITHVMTAAELAKRPFTVVRTRIMLQIASDQLVANETAIGGFGLCVVSSQSVAIGVTAVPTPITDMGSDLWFAHQLVMADFFFITAAGFDAQGGKTFEIDSKAMRKVNDDQEIVLVGEAAGTSLGFNLDIAGRLLIKEH